MSDLEASVEASLWGEQPAQPIGRAIVLPGGSGYTVDHPLLWWTCQVLAAGGWRVVVVRWQVDAAARADPAAFVARAAQRALDVAGPAERTLVVGKSFGTWAAPWAAEHGWPGVWLTPVLTSAEIATGLADTSAPGLLVGGSADELWDADVASTSGLEVLQLEDADHILYNPGDWQRSFAGLQRTLTTVERFAARIA